MKRATSWFALNKAKQWIERRQRWQALLADGLAEELVRVTDAVVRDGVTTRELRGFTRPVRVISVKGLDNARILA